MSDERGLSPHGPLHGTNGFESMRAHITSPRGTPVRNITSPNKPKQTRMNRTENLRRVEVSIGCRAFSRSFRWCEIFPLMTRLEIAASNRTTRGSGLLAKCNPISVFAGMPSGLIAGLCESSWLESTQRVQTIEFVACFNVLANPMPGRAGELGQVSLSNHILHGNSKDQT